MRASRDTVPLLVWSSLNNATKLSNGKCRKVKQWDEKAAVDDYIPEAQQPSVILIPGGFAENLQKFDSLHPNPPDPKKFLLSRPVLRRTVTHTYTYIGEDYGPCVAAVIDHSEKWM
ncbi:hypothetical protein CALCODRAFT_492929 [Calocera cornea HHB12733]|uniref:NmrA-like domain-containing protein n=1 Tax=Calocera cornea HHB12733 TaxID=1353952 RepID=A0A165HZI3_9BASI|nr:hypothetical protein CALCODRAFT_492929 [Calocera cornea HHB12733]